MTMRPFESLITMASGAASIRPGYLPSRWARCFSAFLRTLMSRIAAVTRMPSAALNRAQHDLDGELTFVLAPPRELDSRTHLLRQRLRRGSQAIGDQPFREAFGNNVLHLLPDEFVALVSKLFLRVSIQQDDLSALVHHDHGVGSRIQQAAVPALHLCQVVFCTLAH